MHRTHGLSAAVAAFTAQEITYIKLKSDVFDVSFRMRTAYGLCKSVKNQGLGLRLVGLGLRLGLVVDIRRSGVWADSGR